MKMHKFTKTNLAILGLLAIASVATAAAVSVNDVYFNLQWALNNTGQSTRESIEFGQFTDLQGVPGTDINIMPLKATLKSRLKKTPIVAVIDTGVDVDHPDLQGVLVSKGIDLTPDTLNGPAQDELGHGTHVVGAIAALENNSIGVAGVSSLIKILPIKIFSLKYSNDRGLSDRMVKALQYAVAQKADVINLSLGFPSVFTSPAVTTALNDALAHGIVIVTASGNLGNPIVSFPCNMTGVICVGAIGTDGKVSDFSNQDGQVDMLAPGDFILSTYLRQLPDGVSNQYFVESGYSYLSGTSQSAPFVSAAAAILKGIYPGISNDEVTARLLGSAKPRPAGHEDVLAGLLQIQKAVDLTERAAVYPVFKDFRNIQVDANGKFSIKLPIRNYWGQASGVEVDTRLLNSQATIDTIKSNIGSLAKSTEHTLTLTGHVASMDVESRINLEVTIKVNGTSQSYTHLLNFYRQMQPNEPGVIRMSVASKIADQLFQPIGMNGMATALQTIASESRSKGEPEFFASDNTGKNPIVAYLRTGTSTYVQKTYQLATPAAVTSITQLLLDPPAGSKTPTKAYMVRAEEQPNAQGNKKVHIIYLNSDFTPLYGADSEFIFTAESDFTLGTNDVQFVTAQVGPYSMKIPVFVKFEKLAKTDFNPNWVIDKDPLSINQGPDDVRPHAFYLLPSLSDHTISMRAIDNYQYVNQIYQQLKLGWQDHIYMVGRLSSSTIGEAQFWMLAVSPTNVKSYYRLSIDAGLKPSLTAMQSAVDISMATGLSQMIDTTIKNTNYEAGTSFAFFQSEYLVALTNLGINNKQTHAQSVQNQTILKTVADGQNPFQYALTQFNLNGSNIYFLQTSSDLVSVRPVDGRQPKLAKYPLYRHSVISGDVNSQFYKPVVVFGNASKPSEAGFYVDQTALVVQSAYVIVQDGDKLTAPIKYNQMLPAGCAYLYPVTVSDRDYIAYACHSTGQLQFNFMPLNR